MPTSDTSLVATSSYSRDSSDSLASFASVALGARDDDERESLDERGSSRRLDEIGVEAVLGAMIEQKRRSSSPSFPAITLEAPSARDERGGRNEAEGFVKAR